MKLTRRKLAIGLGAAVPAWLLGRPAVHLARTALGDGPGLPRPADARSTTRAGSTSARSLG